MQQRQDIIPIGGMNTDDDPRHFEQGDYLEARNLHIGSPQDQGTGGLVETIRSNLETTIPIPGGGTIDGEDALDTSHLGVALDEENDFAYILSTMNVSYGPVENELLFVITKHDLSNDTLTTIFAQAASLWGIVPYRENYHAFYNPKIVDDNLIITDNVNNIRQFDVSKLENTYAAGITSQVPEFHADYGDAIGYNPGEYVYWIDRVYVCIQFTGGWSIIDPGAAPSYFTDVGAIVDLYLHIDAPTHFTLIALPPLIAPLAVYGTDSTRGINQLYGRTWQFSYRYIYLDWRKSTFAPPSLVPPPSQEEDDEGVPNPDQTFNNYIDVTFYTGIEEVRAVELIVRSSDDPATWFIWEVIEIITDQDAKAIQSETTFNVRFYNDELSPALTTEEVLTLFSFVPIRAKHMELIEGNRLVFANITEGYSHIETDVTLALSWTNLAGITTEKINYTRKEISQSDGGTGDDWQTEFILPATEPSDPGDIFIRRRFNDVWTEIEYAFVPAAVSWPLGVRDALRTLAIAEWGSGEVETCWTTADDKLCLFPRNQPQYTQPPYYTGGWQTEFYLLSSVVTSVNKYPTLKMGTNQSWGIVYRDIAGRLGPINGADRILTYIPFATENLSGNVDTKPEIDFYINHLPPDWAEEYEIVYAGNKSMNYWLHAYGYNFGHGKKDHDDPDDDTGYVIDRSHRLRIGKAFDNTRSYLPGWVVEEYVWQKGDRIRIFGKVDNSGVLTEENGYVWDSEITGVFVDSDYGTLLGETPSGDVFQYEWIYFNIDRDSGLLPTNVPGFEWLTELFIEIYRPFVVETGLFFTTGMTYAIEIDGFGNKYHAGDVSPANDQVLNSGGVSTSPAVVRNTAHDGWKYLRSFRNRDDDQTFPFWSESQYASDYNKQQILTSQGFPIPLIASAQQNVLTKRLRHGGAISIGSQLNSIADFEFDDFLDLKDEDGPIEGIRYVGFTLKAIQYTRVISIYISRQESFTAQGDAQYLFTDKVFGSTRPSLNAWGTSHPDSVINDNRHLWFWDQSEGIVVRDAPNGQVAISDNKMKRFFTDKAREQDAIPKERQVATMAYSMETEEVFINFSDADSFGDSEVIIMNEKDQRWKSKIDLFYYHGQFYWVGKRLFHLFDLSENLHEWWRGDDYLEIGGRNLSGSLTVYATGGPQKVKTFDAIHVYQTNQTPEFGLVLVPIKATATSIEMRTIINAANIKEREGIFYCEVMRDIYNPWDPSKTENWRLVNGYRMRGLYMSVELQFTEHLLPVTLSNIAVITTPSERSK